MGAKKQAKGRAGRQPQPPSPPLGTTAARSASAARVQCRGAGAVAPGEINFWAPPSRREGGQGGWGKKQAKGRDSQCRRGLGAAKQAKGRAGRQPQPPSPPSGTTAAGLSGTAGASSPRRVCDLPLQSRCRPGSVQGCRGRSPRRNKLLGSPPSRREGGQGGWGQKSKLKAGQGGNPNRQAPL